MIKRDPMDPKALSHLDPKQKEAYARVMGTAAVIHSDTPAQDASPVDALVNADPATTQTSPSTPFDITTGGLSDSPTISSPTPLNTSPGLSEGSTPADPSQSLFSSSPVQEASADTSLSSTLSSSPDGQATTDLSQPDAAAPTDTTTNSSFFSNSPIPSTAETPDVTPELAPQEAFPPVTTQPEATIASDNLAPVTPYDPSSENNQPQGAVSMEQPFNTQPLPSPADVTQANTPKETSPLLRVLYIVGAVVFFAIYTIFWVKVFNLPFIF